MKSLLALIVCAAFVVDSSARATIYEINLSVGAGTVTGVIQTNGVNGELSPSDVIDWSLLINNGAPFFQFIWPIEWQQFAGFGFWSYSFVLWSLC